MSADSVMDNRDPLACFVCGRELEHAAALDLPVCEGGMSVRENQVRRYGYLPAMPKGATAFHTQGHYGSQHFDCIAQDGIEGEIAVCSRCLDAHPDRIRCLRGPGKKTEVGTYADIRDGRMPDRRS